MAVGDLYERRMTEVLDRLQRAGYSESFRGEPGGIRGLKSGIVHRPEDLEIQATERFEGISNPDDETLVLVLSCRLHGCRGTYVVPYGKDMPSTDSALVERLPDARRRDGFRSPS